MRIINDSGAAIMEYDCSGCGETLHSDLIVWAHDDGTLSTDTGKPWCESCCPEEPEEDTK